MNRLMTFDKYRVFETEFAGRPLKVETGKMTQLANGACLVHYGDTTVHVAVTASEKPREGVDFFPLSVDYEEKMYAVGKIPGSYLKREGRPSEKAILTSRVIDRPIRPLFDKSMRNDVSIVCTVMSVDPDCQPEIVAMIGASIAISISDVPWNGPISGCSVGMIDGEYIINPTEEQRKVSQMATTVASTSTRIAMIEAGANCVSDDDMYNAIMAGHEANQKIISFIEEIKAEIGKPKVESAKETMEAINPDVTVKTYHTFVTSENILDLVKEYDFIIDGTDNFPAKFLINDACVMAKKPFSHAGIIRFKGQLMTYVPGEGPCYRCVFKNPPPKDAVPTCKQAGVIGAMGGVIGSLQAMEAIKYIIGQGELLTGYLLTYDALKMEFRKVKLPSDTHNCAVCGDHPTITELIDYEQAECDGVHL